MYKILKRIVDLLFAIFLLIFLSPVLVIIVLILLTKGQKAFFVQERQGYQGRLFKIIKFKTMKDESEKDEKYALQEAKRITKTGAFLRKYHLDELPQLINIIKGEMSFIGPRPLLPEYEKYYTPEQKLRFEVFPGLTGWAQIQGGNEISWKSKLSHDIWYVQNTSLLVDLFIVFKTIHIIGSISANKPLYALEKFNGTN